MCLAASTGGTARDAILSRAAAALARRSLLPLTECRLRNNSTPHTERRPRPSPRASTQPSDATLRGATASTGNRHSMRWPSGNCEGCPGTVPPTISAASPASSEGRVNRQSSVGLSACPANGSASGISC